MKKSNLEENNNGNILSIQVSLDGFSFYTKNPYSDVLGISHHFETKKQENPETILNEIIKIFAEKEIDQLKFKQVDVTYRNELYTIVPLALFDPENISEYLKFNTKVLSTDFIEYDEIKPYDLITVYIPFANINNYFFDCFGSFDYHHSMTVFIDKQLRLAPALEKKQICIHIEHKNMDLMASAGKKLLLANTFHFETPEDFLYYTLFCYEQLNFDPDKDLLKISGDLDKDSPLYKLAYKYIRYIELEGNENMQTKVL